jgi:hypothetical protein
LMRPGHRRRRRHAQRRAEQRRHACFQKLPHSGNLTRVPRTLATHGAPMGSKSFHRSAHRMAASCVCAPEIRETVREETMREPGRTR